MKSHRIARRLGLALIGCALVAAISIASTIALAQLAPQLLPQGPRGAQGAQGPRGEQGLQGIRGVGGPAGENGQPGAAEAGANQSDGGPTGPKHYYYDGKDLGTVAQHEQYCRLLRDQLDAEGVNDQDKLEAEGCRGGGSIGSP
jgi:hypothetical protein